MQFVFIYYGLIKKLELALFHGNASFRHFHLNIAQQTTVKACYTPCYYFGGGCY